jgi:peptidoglycan/LPS O-acetylase OafA/YrhL
MKEKTSSKFIFLDGIRGLSALFVAFYHAQLFTGHTDDYLHSSLKPLNIFLDYGHFSVAVFIVLSGFCLTIPVAKSEDIQLKGGFKRYIGRRFTRILPPYYFALTLSLILIYTFPILQTSNNTVWDSKIPITLGSVLSHLLLLHNFSEDWILKINGPFWSVATEWQIYFVFPILLYIWRKSNVFISLVSAVFLGTLIAFILPVIHSWYLGLFALGMVSSTICFSRQPLFILINSRLNWPLLSATATVLLIAFLGILHFKTFHLLISESIVGLLMCVILINFIMVDVKSLRRPFMLKIFSSKFAVFIGTFSYSIYLIHSPILGLLNLLSLQYQMNVDTRLLLMLFISVPFSVLISYGFYLLVESRFIPGKRDLKENKLDIHNLVDESQLLQVKTDKSVNIIIKNI